MKYKNCRKCKEDKSVAEFSKSARNKDGLRSYCKACDSKVSKRWYSNNKQSNKERSQRWLAENKEVFREYQKSWEEENKKSRRNYHASWYQNNKERISRNHKEWWNNNPHKRRLYKNKYYGKIRNQGGEVSPDIIEKLFLIQNNLCYYCEGFLEEFHLEHMVPISRGGLHDDNNLCLSCPPCNLKKHTKTAEEFMADKEGITNGS